MALVHRTRQPADTTPVQRFMRWPGEWARFMDWDDAGNWLKVEEFEDDGSLVIRAELPDIDVDKDLDVTVEEGFVHIQGHREQKEEHKEKDSYRSEFRYGEFHRDIPLPQGATQDDVKATYTDGILEVRVPCPKAGPDRSTRVPITRT